MKYVHSVVAALIIFAALNWGLVGLLGFDLVAKVLGLGLLSKIVYIALGAAGAIAVYTEFAVRKSGKTAPVMPSRPRESKTLHGLTP